MKTFFATITKLKFLTLFNIFTIGLLTKLKSDNLLLDETVLLSFSFDL